MGKNALITAMVNLKANVAELTLFIIIITLLISNNLSCQRSGHKGKPVWHLDDFLVRDK